jgi:hypothetical protein
VSFLPLPPTPVRAETCREEGFEAGAAEALEVGRGQAGGGLESPSYQVSIKYRRRPKWLKRKRIWIWQRDRTPLSIKYPSSTAGAMRGGPGRDVAHELGGGVGIVGHDDAGLDRFPDQA